MRPLLRVTFFILLALPFCLTAQIADTDSLLNVLEHSRNDEDKAGLYIAVTESLREMHPDSALEYAGMAMELALKTKNNKLLAESYRQIGMVHNAKDEEEISLDYFNRALEIYKELEDQESVARVYNNISSIHYYRNNYFAAEEFTNNALEIAKAIGDEKIIATSYFYLGNISKRNNDFKKALDYYTQSLELRRKAADKDELASVLNNIGTFYMERGDFANAVKYLEETLEIRRQLKSPRSTGIVLNNLGNASLELEEYNKAIAYYTEASEIFRELDFDTGTAATLTGMATIYERLDQYESALEVYDEILKLREENNDPWELANTYNNISIIYSYIFKDSLQERYGRYYDEIIYQKGIDVKLESARRAVNYGLRALEKRREIDDKAGISISLANLGMMYSNLGKYDEAQNYWQEWMEMPSEFRDEKIEMISVYIGLGRIANTKHDYSRALDYISRALAISEAMDSKRMITESALELSRVYENMSNYREALKYFRKYAEASDSLIKMDTRRQIHEMQVKYETEAKERENEILRKDQMLTESKLQLRNKALFTSGIVLLVFIIMLIQLIRQNNLRKKAYEELAKKNELITAQKKEITDSIEYASRIQSAILPPPDYINRLLPEQFIVYRPRDIVSGDFYWITEKNNLIVTVVADCTGHGVPGAFMSMLGVAFLNEIISKNGSIPANLVLHELRKQVIESLHQTGKEGESQDGMDLSLFILDKKNMRLQFAGANNSLIICRGEELVELKADKMPIGIHAKAAEPFKNYHLDLEKGDMLYAFTDGYPDQFGGPKGKKFMIKSFKKMLLEIRDKEVSEQKKLLENTLDNWMGDSPQVDDILVMGVRM